MYMMFVLEHEDVLPLGDLAIRRGIEQLYGDGEEELTREEMREIAETWRPYRSVAARYIWAAYESDYWLARRGGPRGGTTRASLRPSLAEQLAGDDVLLYLGRPLVDLGYLGVPVEPFDVEVVDVAGAAVDLEGLVGDVDGDLRGELFGHRRQHRQIVVRMIDTQADL